VIPETKAVRNLSFYVEFLAELRGHFEKKAVRDKKYIVKTVSSHICVPSQ
jgi:hypothetical protein